jgi:asparagine synthase (glutamine-hydrolysing)
MDEYLNFASNFSNQPRFLDFIAVKELFEKQNKKYLFLPGHVLDFIAGSRIPERVKTEKKLSFDDVFKLYLLRPYSFYPKNKKAEQIIKNKIITKNKIPQKCSGWEAISFFESWEWKERQGKYVINGLNIYNFFGFEWYTPFLEKEFLDFFSSLSYQFRYRQNFQKQALHYLFPNFYPKEEWLKPLNIKEGTVISKIKKELVKFPLVKYLYSKRVAYRCLLTDFGLKRYTVFDNKSKNIKLFGLKNVLTNNVKRIFYFYTLEYLLRNNFNLDFLSNKYLKKLREVYKKD